MGWREHAGAGRVVGSGPALAVVVQVAEQVKVLLPAGWAGIEGLAGGQLHTRNDEVQLMVVRMTVPHPQDIALVRLQARESHPLEVVHDALFLLRRHRVVGVPRQHPGGETPCGVQRVDKVAGRVHVPAQHFWRRFVTARIIWAHKVVGGAFARALAVREDFHVHGESSGASGGAVSALTAFSRLTRAVSTSRASARLLWMLAQRAS